MALKISFNKELQYVCQEIHDSMTRLVSFPDCYVQVAGVDAEKLNASARVSYFSDNSKNKLLFTKSFCFTPQMTSENFIAQAYAYLKTLPEFQGAEDC